MDRYLLTVFNFLTVLCSIATGEGEFGSVYKGSYLTDQGVLKEVAVKALTKEAVEPSQVPTLFILILVLCRWRNQETIDVSLEDEDLLLFATNPVARVSDSNPDPYWIRIQSGQWIRIQEGKRDPQK